MIKAIIYDLDDLMVNSIALHIKAWDILFSEYHVKISDLPPDLSSHFMGMRISDVLKEMINYFNLEVDYQTLYQKRQEIFLQLVAEKLEILPGLIESLHLFKDNQIKIALASSGTTKYINLVLKKFRLSKYFNVIISGDDVKNGKPDPETYLIACQKLGLKPEECLVLEDATNGIEAAKKAGCKCIAINNPYTPPQDRTKADLILDSLSEIDLDILKTL